VGKVGPLALSAATARAAENGRGVPTRGMDKDQLVLAEVAHELRTPLAAIAASAELLADNGHGLSADRVRKTARDILRASVWLQTLVENILLANAVMAGRFRLSLELLELPEILNEVRPLLAPVLERRHQRLRASRRGGEVRMLGDRRRLAQVLLNLLSNASRHAPVGGTIDLFVRGGDQRVRVIVADRGPGLGEAGAADLFEPFYQGASPRTLDGGGVGLGLTVVRTIVERHGGRVGAMNRKGGGAAFWFELPRRPAG
jgi:signal transduction histidine kinase